MHSAPTARGTGQLTEGRGGKKRRLWASEPVPRAIVVYPLPLYALPLPLVDIPPRRSRILIQRCRSGILHTVFILYIWSQRHKYKYSTTCHSPQAPGVGFRDPGVGGAFVSRTSLWEHWGLEYSTERKCSRPLLNLDKDIDTAAQGTTFNS